MFSFGIVAAPAAVATVPLVAVVLFTLFIFLVPGTLVIVIKERLGISKSKGKRQINRALVVKKLVGFALYHALMLGIWVISWPQFTNPVHSGYDSITGMGYLLLVMVFWTGTGMLAIYSWNLLWNSRTRVPGLGFFLRLFVWNCIVMFIFRQIIYWFIAG